jgi:hypothetical protein
LKSRQPKGRSSHLVNNSVSNESVSTDTYNLRQVFSAANSMTAAASTCIAAAATLAYASGVHTDDFVGQRSKMAARRSGG